MSNPSWIGALGARPLLTALTVAGGLLWARPTRGAAPPESPYFGTDRPSAEPPPTSECFRQAEGELSSLHLEVGPALLLRPGAPGLGAALDWGAAAVGARVFAAWLQAASERGLSVYGGELRVDFRPRAMLHPILGAGAGVLYGGALGGEAAVGAATLRGALEYQLPLEATDARLGLGVTGLLPAVAAEGARPFAFGALSLGVGF